MIKIGQVYRSNDPRDKGRTVKVIAKANARHWHVENVKTERRTRISKTRLEAKGTRGWELLTAWDNFGQPVSVKRLNAGEAALKEILPAHSARIRIEVLGFFRNAIERDEPARLLAALPDSVIGMLDLSGRYRLLASMLAEPE